MPHFHILMLTADDHKYLIYFMRKIILSAAVIFSVFCFFYSCKKETLPAAAPPPILNPPIGKEVVFDDLTWNHYRSGFNEWDEIYLAIPRIPDLNEGTIGRADVFLKYDTSSNWTEVFPEGASTVNQHVYFFYGQLIVEVYPLNYQLPGRKASVKVKFK